MKQVYENSMVAHVWANQSQPSARSNNGQFYFDGPRLYSYGSHYLMGLILDGATLINSTSYSVTTSKHFGYARRSASGAVFLVPDLTLLDRAGFAKPGYKSREVLRDYLLNHASEISDEAAKFLLRYAGHADPIAKWITIRETAERHVAAAQKKEEQRDRKSKIAYAMQVLQVDLLGAAEKFREATPYELAQTAKNLYRSHRALKAAKRDKAAGEIWLRLSAVRAEIKRREKFADQLGRIGRCTRAANTVREFFNTIKDLPRERMESSAIKHASASMSALCHSAHMAPATRVKLFGIIGGLNEAAMACGKLEQAELEAERALDIAAWLSGGATRHNLYGIGRTLIRATGVERDANRMITGGKLETSQGADVPLTHAVRAFRFLKMCRLTGRAWSRNGRSVRVGHFQIDSIAPDGSFRAGCHSIEWGEVERLATQLGVFELPASDIAVESRADA